jgi:threonine/homoserine/homoserine lactone efflux protein
MEITNFAIFLAASWGVILTPGPDMLYVITHGLSHGRKAGLLSAAGIAMGLLMHTTFAALGLAIVLRTSALAWLIVKYAGAVYLICLGIKSIREKSPFILKKNKTPLHAKTIFVHGMLSNLLNPKIALFFLAFLPQFVNPELGNTAFQMAFMGLIFAFCGIVFLAFIGYFSGHIGSWLGRKAFFAAQLRYLTGSILIALGTRLIFLDRN